MPIVLATKLHAPVLALGTVMRPRLLERLTAGAAANATLICAPAGYGKSTLAVSWLTSPRGAAGGTPPAFAWYSLDPSDDDPATFFAYLIAAIRTVYPDACPQAQALADRLETTTVEQLGITLAVECLALPARLCLVFDDLHHIRNDGIHRVLVNLQHDAGSHLHLVALTRADPPWRISHLRAQRRLAEIRAADLQFTRTEMLDLLAAGLDRPPDEHVCSVLYQQTEGWAAGLHLATLGLNANADPDQFLEDLTLRRGRYIFDYLVDEVLSAQPTDVQRLLLATAFLDRFTAPLAAAILGDLDVATCTRIVDDIQRSNLFVIALDERRQWFRYHHLFGEMLRNRTYTSRAEQREQHLRAAGWFAAHNLIDEALTHYAAAHDYVTFAALLERQLPAIYEAQRWRDLRRRLDTLPAAWLEQRPLLLLAQCMLWEQETRLGPIPAALHRVEALLASPEAVLDPAQRALADGHLALLTSLTAVDRTPEERFAFARYAVERLPLQHQYLHGSAYFEFVVRLAALGRPDEAIAAAQRALQDLPSGYDIVQASLVTSIGFLQFRYGSLIELRHLAANALQAQERAGPTYAASAARYALAFTLYQQGDLAAARTLLEYVIDWANPAIWILRLTAYYLLLRLDAMEQRPDRIAPLVAALQRTLQGSEAMPLPDCVEALLALAALVTGDRASALAWAGRPLPTSWYGYFDHRTMIRARILIAAGTPASLAQAIILLEEFRRRRAAEHETVVIIEASVLLAQALWLQQAHAPALDALAAAIDLGFPLGYRSSFIEEPAVLGAMLRELLRRGRCQGAASALLAALPVPAAPAASTPAAGVRAPAPAATPAPVTFTPANAAVVTLTPRELEIVACLSRRMSNKEIAAELVLSPLTVRNHVVRLMTKLNVANRRQVVAYAQRHGLLSPPPP